MTGVKGLYNFETEYSSDGSINITVSGLFFVSVSIPVTNADVGKAVLISSIAHTFADVLCSTVNCMANIASAVFCFERRS